MQLKEIIELILKKIKNSCSIRISDFLKENNLENLKVKELVKEIEKNYNKELILDLNDEEIYSYDLVYTFFKLKLFNILENENDLDLSSEDFKIFKSQDLIRIFSLVNIEFFNYLLENI